VSEVVVVVVFVGAYVLIATEWVHRVVVALAGAGLMLLFRVLDAHEAFSSERTGVDWNVVFLLLGMMIIVAVLRRTGVFEYLAIWSAKRARGRPFRVLVMLVVITAVASALLDNVTTVLLVAPVTLLLCERLAVPPVPFLMAEAMASNIGGTATLVGDPPNIIIASEAHLSYLSFLGNMAPLVLLLLVAFVAISRPVFGRAAFGHDPARAEEVMALDEREALQRGPVLTRAAAVLAVVTAGFVLQGVIGYDPSVIALLGAGVLLLVAGDDVEGYLREVEWGTLLFFVGLFVMVGALVKVGVIHRIATSLVDLTHGRLLLATLLLLVVSAVLSGIVDNVPYVATMAPVVRELARTMPGNTAVLWWALALGADLGGNATSIGASANVVVLGISERAGHRITFGAFLRRGVIVTAVTVSLSAVYLWVRYFLLA
jgi:Na+/H+ antiporter NhaD/arsenite permease-like protein